MAPRRQQLDQTNPHFAHTGKLCWRRCLHDEPRGRLKIMVFAVCLLALEMNPIKITGNDFRDLDVIGQAIETANIVEIGEATHGASEFYRLKLRLVKFLHEKRGFNILAIESGMIETGLAALRRLELSAEDWMMTTVSAAMRWQEMQSLFTYLKDRPKLRVIGIDPQLTATEVLDYASDVVVKDNPELASQIRKRLGEPYTYRLLQHSDTEGYARAESSYLDWLRATSAKLEMDPPSPGQENAKNILQRGLAGLMEYWEGASRQTLIERFQTRDRIMAAHLLDQIGQEKAIVWAHNGHIGQGLGYRIMGDYLREQRKGKVYSLGLFGKSGEWREHMSGEVKPWGASADGLEATLKTSKEAAFRSTKSLTNPLKAFEPENGGMITFVPANRFHGLIVVEKLTPAQRPERALSANAASR